MNAEERALRAIKLTRDVLQRALNYPSDLVQLFSLKSLRTCNVCGIQDPGLRNQEPGGHLVL